MKYLSILVLSTLCGCALAASQAPATEGTLQTISTNVQAVKTSVQAAETDLKTISSELNTLDASVQSLRSDVRDLCGGLEYVGMAIAQAFYFGLGVALFYVFDRGRIARDIW